MRINLNSPDGNILFVIGKVINELCKHYPKEEVEKWIKSVMYKRSYQQILDKILEDWVLWDKAEPLEFYQSASYEMDIK